MSGCLALLLLSPALGGERPDFTGGVATFEGAAGGGLVPWALVAGLGTADEVGANAVVSAAETGRFSLKVAGLAIGVGDRLELSYAHESFGIGAVVPGGDLGQDIAGIKLRLAGDAVFDQDRPWPQLAAGVLYKHSTDFAGVPAALGARRAEGTDFYLAATKVWLDGIAGHRLLLDLTLRRSDANQYGLLGFGGSRAAAWRPEASAGVWLLDELLAGVEFRAKRAGLAAPAEGNAGDAFIAWRMTRHLTLVVAYVDLGPIAFQPAQRGAYLSLTAPF